MTKKFTSHSIQETQTVAKEILATLKPRANGATVVGLSGDLGAGKTTFTQAIAKELGISETIISPTFVIAKFYEVLKSSGSSFEQLVHIDAYRLEESEEMRVLGFKTIISQPNTLVIIEWPEKIADILPDDILTVSINILEHDSREFLLS